MPRTTDPSNPDDEVFEAVQKLIGEWVEKHGTVYSESETRAELGAKRTRWGLEALIVRELFSSLLRQVRHRDPPLATAFLDAFRLQCGQASHRIYWGHPTSAMANLLTALGRLDLRDMRLGRSAKDRPPDTELLERYELVHSALKKLPRPAKVRNPAHRKLRLQEILVAPELSRAIPKPIPDARLHEWSRLAPEELALRVVAWPYQTHITPETLRKNLSHIRSLRLPVLREIAALLKAPEIRR